MKLNVTHLVFRGYGPSFGGTGMRPLGIQTPAGQQSQLLKV
jgi:hypothetical protein